jgi:hypothetical protein
MVMVTRCIVFLPCGGGNPTTKGLFGAFDAR